jgi:Arylsulfotransferase (ASST)
MDHRTRVSRSGRWRLLAVAAVAGLAVATADAEEPAAEQAGELTSAMDRDEGRFRSPRRLQKLDPEQAAMIERLEALGYAQGVVDASAFEGVTLHDRARAQAGYNLVTSGHAQVVQLMDMDGAVLHEWRADFSMIWPELAHKADREQAVFFRRAYLLDDGGILAIYEGFGMLRLDRTSKLLWSRENLAHHDLQVLEDGTLVVLTRKAHLVPRINPDKPILEDYVSWLDLDTGEDLREPVSMLECFENSEEFRPILEAHPLRAGDLFHTNGLEVLDGRFDHPAFTAGNLLLSFSKLHAVGVADPVRQEMVWVLQGDFKRQHDPRILGDGTLMLFDNRGVNFDDGKGLEELSRVLVYDPATKERGWSYEGDDEHPFYTRTCGTNQRLPGGNTLITESDNGRAFEVAPDGTIVWEYYNPHHVGRYVASLLEVERVEVSVVQGWDWLELPEPEPAAETDAAVPVKEVSVPTIVWIATAGIAVVAVVVVVAVRRKTR